MHAFHTNTSSLRQHKKVKKLFTNIHGWHLMLAPQHKDIMKTAEN